MRAQYHRNLDDSQDLARSCVSPFVARSFTAMYLRVRLYSNQFFLEALIFVVLVADFTASPGQVNYNAPVAEVFFTTTIQNVFEIAAAVVDLLAVVIVVVASTAAATTVNLVSKVSDQRQLR